ncbi:MAG: hypothetical protein KGP29_02445 [Proteobacteria bacterium]|nr:hypothetical protein [Pseudomonadota bacterium]
MSRTRKAVTQKDADDMMQTLSKAGYTREQLLQALNQNFPEQEEELLKATTALSLEDVKVNTSQVIGSSLGNPKAVVLSSASELDDSLLVGGGGKLKASAIADEKEETDNDFSIDPKDLVENDEEPIQKLPQRKRGESKDSDSSTEVIMGDGKSSGNKSRVSTGGTTVTTPNTRGRTAAGPQVEHALAYVVYESIAKKAIAGQKISQASEKMREAFEAFPIKPEAMEELISRTEAISQEALRFRTTKRSLKERKDSGNNPLSEEDYSATHDALIIAARAQYAKMIEATMDVCLFGANKMPNVSYPTEGVAPNPNTGKEKEAKNNLLLLDNFIERVASVYNSSAEDAEEAKTNLLNDSEFLGRLKTKWGVSREIVESLFEITVPSSATASADLEDSEESPLEQKLSEVLLPRIHAQLARNMGELFYYPSLPVDQTHRYPIKVGSGRTERLIEENWSVSQEEWQDVMKANPTTGERVEGAPKYNKGTLPRSNNLDEMYKTVAQAEVAFSKLLPSLQYFGEEKYEAIMNGFLINSVISNSQVNGGKGWGRLIEQQMIKDGKIGSTVTINSLLNELQEGVSSYAKIKFDSPENFYMKNSVQGERLNQLVSSAAVGLEVRK